MLRRSDFIGLFDTAPDLSGADSTSPPTSGTPTTWTPSSRGPPGAGRQGWTARRPADARLPSAEFRCRVPLGELSTFLKRDDASVAAGPGARPVDPGTSQAKARPGEVLLVNAADGGYDPEAGFDPGCSRSGAR